MDSKDINVKAQVRHPAGFIHTQVLANQQAKPFRSKSKDKITENRGKTIGGAVYRNKNHSKVPRIVRVPSRSKLNKNTFQMERKLDYSGDNKPGTSKLTDKPSKKKLSPERLKPSHIPRPKPTVKDNANKDSTTKKNYQCVGDSRNSRNVQRIQLLINQDFRPEERIPVSSIARPIPTLGQLYARNNGMDAGILDGWFVELEAPVNSMASNFFNISSRLLDAQASAANDKVSANKYQITNVSNLELDDSKYPPNAFKTTDENISDWLSSSFEYPTRDNESGYRSVSPPTQTPVDIKSKSKCSLASTTPESAPENKEQQLSESNSKKSLQGSLDIKSTATTLKEQPTVVFTPPPVSNDNPEENKEGEKVTKSADHSKNNQYPSRNTCAPTPVQASRPQNMVSSYVECPSEILQKTTNFEADDIIPTSDTTNTISSVAGTDLELRDNLSNQYIVERDDCIMNDLCTLEWCHQCRSCGRDEKSMDSEDTSVADSLICQYNDDLLNSSLMNASDDQFAHQCRWKRRYDGVRHCKKCQRYRRFPSTRYKLPKTLASLRKRMSLRLCRRRLSKVWKKTAERWAMWSAKPPHKFKKPGMMQYLQRAILWEDADVQTNTFVYRETDEAKFTVLHGIYQCFSPLRHKPVKPTLSTPLINRRNTSWRTDTDLLLGTEPTLREQKSAALSAILKFGLSSTGNKNGSDHTSASPPRNNSSKSRQINIGPSMYPLVCNNSKKKKLSQEYRQEQNNSIGKIKNVDNERSIDMNYFKNKQPVENHVITQTNSNFHSKVADKNEIKQANFDGCTVNESDNYIEICELSTDDKHTGTDDMANSLKDNVTSTILHLDAFRHSNWESQNANTQMHIFCSNAGTDVKFPPTQDNRSASVCTRLSEDANFRKPNGTNTDLRNLHSINLMTSASIKCLSAFSHIDTQVTPVQSLKKISTGILTTKSLFENKAARISTSTGMDDDFKNNFKDFANQVMPLQPSFMSSVTKATTTPASALKEACAVTSNKIFGCAGVSTSSAQVKNGVCLTSPTISRQCPDIKTSSRDAETSHSNYDRTSLKTYLNTEVLTNSAQVKSGVCLTSPSLCRRYPNIETSSRGAETSHSKYDSTLKTFMNTGMLINTLVEDALIQSGIKRSVSTDTLSIGGKYTAEIATCTKSELKDSDIEKEKAAHTSGYLKLRSISTDQQGVDWNKCNAVAQKNNDNCTQFSYIANSVAGCSEHIGHSRLVSCRTLNQVADEAGAQTEPMRFDDRTQQQHYLRSVGMLKSFCGMTPPCPTQMENVAEILSQEGVYAPQHYKGTSVTASQCSFDQLLKPTSTLTKNRGFKNNFLSSPTSRRKSSSNKCSSFRQHPSISLSSDIDTNTWTNSYTEKGYECQLEIGCNLNDSKPSSVSNTFDSKPSYEKKIDSKSVGSETQSEYQNLANNVTTVASLRTDMALEKFNKNLIKKSYENQMVRMVDDVTSDEVIKKEVKEMTLQANPDSCDAATECLQVTEQKSASVITSRCILPVPSLCTCQVQNCGPIIGDCLFVYGKPRCVMHSKDEYNDASVQMSFSRNHPQYCQLSTQMQSDLLQQHLHSVGMLTSFYGMTCNPQMDVAEMLSPKMYEAIYETTKQITQSQESKIQNVKNLCYSYGVDAEVGTADLFHAPKTRSASTVTSPDVQSAAIVTSQCECRGVLQNDQFTQQGLGSIEESVFCFPSWNDNYSLHSGEDKDADGDVQANDSQHAKLLDIPTHDYDPDCDEKRAKTHLITSCRYYSSLLTKQLDRVREQLTKHLMPLDGASYAYQVPSVCAEACTMKPSAREEFGCQTFKNQQYYKRSRFQNTLTPAISLIDIRQHDQEHLQSVYYMLSAIEGRLRRFKNNVE